MKTRVFFYALVPMFCLLYAAMSASNTSSDETFLRAFFDDSHQIQTHDFETVLKVSLELGERAVPALNAGLNCRDHRKSELAIQALLRVGGPKAVKALREFYKTTGDEWTQAYLCRAMASTGSRDDIRFLTKALNGPHLGVGSAPVSAAAYALGVLKVTEAQPQLELLAKDESSIAGEAARQALTWIRGTGWATPQETLASGSDAVILALFRFGIPSTDQSDTFADSVSKRLWKREGDTWTYSPLPQGTKDTPGISFRVDMNTEETRAYCFVGLHFGELAGKGCEAMLWKEKGVWKVAGFCVTMAA